MISMQHHYGVACGVQSTPFWMMASAHQIGANDSVSSVNNIQAFREARNWSRPELAKRMGTSPQQIERLEKGHRTLRQSWIDKAAAAFEVEPAAIISSALQPVRSPNQISVSIPLPSVEALTEMFAGLLDLIEVDPEEDERAKRLARSFPSAFQAALLPPAPQASDEAIAHEEPPHADDPNQPPTP